MSTTAAAVSNDNTNMASSNPASTVVIAGATNAPSVVTSSSEMDTSSVASNHSQSQSTTTTNNNNNNNNNAASRGGAAAVAVAAASGSGKRTLITHTKDGKLLSEKKLRRLEKNRLSARECRRRKREATENLEREIYVLEGENLRLRLQLQIGEEAEESMRQEQDKVTENIDALLKSGASEAAIYATIEEFKEKFADYGRDRRSAIHFHLMNIERLLMPTQTTTLAMRALQGGSQVVDAAEGVDSNATSATTAMDATTTATTTQPDPTSVSQSSTNNGSTTLEPPNADLEPKALFKYLVKYLEVTPEQAAALKDSRFVAQEMDGILIKALAVLEELRTRLAQCGEDLETEFNNIRSILTPTQAAKFLIWVANNSACMHMLNELWSRVYPQTTLEQQHEGGSDVDSP